MCGYVGTIGYGPDGTRQAVERLRHRGPDSIGVHWDPASGCALAHARLKIIDLADRANQPFVSPDGRYVLVFNGEIYNYRELRQQLVGLGETFATSSDTEVLLKWVTRYGMTRLPELDGMFSFALLDQQERSLCLVRDPIGEKPLYLAEVVADDGRRRFAFGSEIKALLPFAGIDLSLDTEALADYLRFLYTVAPRTLYRGIKEVPPGHYVRITATEGAQWQRYYDLESSVARDCRLGLEDASERFAEKLRTSVSRRLVSDVDVGLFLSGGIDSNALLGIWTAAAERPLKAFVAQYDGNSDESRVAVASAARLGAATRVLKFDRLQFHASLDRVTQMFDQPFGNSTALVAEQLSAQAAAECRVCLVGDGGDEVSAGYPRYRAALLRSRLGAGGRGALSLVSAIAGRMPEAGPPAKFIRRVKRFSSAARVSSAEAFIEWSSYLSTADLGRLMGRTQVVTDSYERLVALYNRNQQRPLLAAALVDFASFVPFNLMQSADRTGMAHSLELRSPFLSRELIEFALAVPDREKVRRTGLTKPLITTALRESFAPGIAAGKKKPFNPPLRRMLMSCVDELGELLLSPAARIRDVIDAGLVRDRLTAFRLGQEDCSTFLWGIATLERWLQGQPGSPGKLVVH